MLTAGNPRRAAPRPAQRGLSIVEMMVGVVIGLLVVAAASMVVATQLTENRRLLVETQLEQDLRATADIMTREVRRAGAWAGAVNAVSQPAAPNPTKNGYAALAATPATEIDYMYQVASSDPGIHGFKLVHKDSVGVIQALLTNSGFQDLTDSSTVDVQAFNVTIASGDPLQIPCPKICAGGGTACWPTITVRNVTFAVTAAARSDPTNVRRTLNWTVKVRNDLAGFNDAAHPNQYCPA